MNKSKIIHQVKRLIIASDSFQQIIAMINYMDKMKIDFENILHPTMIAGITVSYARNFNEANGLGPLPKSYTKFENKHLEESHKQIIDARNKLHAHRDIDYQSTDDREPYRVQVTFCNETERVLFQPILQEIHAERLSDIKSLVTFQLDRLQEDLDKKLTVVVDLEKEYDFEQMYYLGIDFP